MTIILDGTTGITTPAINSSGDLELPGGTTNGVLYLNGSKVATSGSALTYDGTTFKADAAAVFNDSGADVDFRVEGDTDANLLFVDASADFVGIGTSTPATKLDVSGRAQFVNNGFNYVLVDSTVSDSYFRLASAGTVKWYLRNNTANTNALEITPDAGSTTGLFLTQSGNLGLGVTPSAWNTVTAIQAKSAHFGGYSHFAYLGANCFYESGWKYIGNAYANRIEMLSGQFQFYTAPSGTAGAAISFTQAMTLDASGNLGVGTTTPAAKLSVKTSSTGGNIVNNWENYSAFGTGVDSSTGAGVGIGYNSTSGRGEIVSISPTIAWRPLGLYSSGIEFYATNGNESARITSGGQFLLGATSFTSGGIQKLLVIEDPTSCGITLNRGAGVVASYIYSYSSTGFRVETTGSYATVEIVSGGTGGVSLSSGGTSWSSMSDERMKEIIEPISNAVEKVSSLRTVIGRFKSDNDSARRSFLIAQDVQAVLPEAVSNFKVKDDDNEYLGLQYTDTIPLLVAAIKEQQAMIEDLKAKVAALEVK